MRRPWTLGLSRSAPSDGGGRSRRRPEGDARRGETPARRAALRLGTEALTGGGDRGEVRAGCARRRGRRVVGRHGWQGGNATRTFGRRRPGPAASRAEERGASYGRMPGCVRRGTRAAADPVRAVGGARRCREPGAALDSARPARNRQGPIGINEDQRLPGVPRRPVYPSRPRPPNQPSVGRGFDLPASGEGNRARPGPASVRAVLVEAADAAAG